MGGVYRQGADKSSAASLPEEKNSSCPVFCPGRSVWCSTPESGESLTIQVKWNAASVGGGNGGQPVAVCVVIPYKVRSSVRCTNVFFVGVKAYVVIPYQVNPSTTTIEQAKTQENQEGHNP